MCDCVSFITVPWRKIWKPALVRLIIAIRTQHIVYPAVEAQAYDLNVHQSNGEANTSSQSRGNAQVKSSIQDVVDDSVIKTVALTKREGRYSSNGGSGMVSLFTKQGRKGINQDTMIVIEKFAFQHDTIFCGVFDGHGQDGHLIARNVRDLLPQKLASSWQAQQQAAPVLSDASESDGIVVQEGEEFMGDPTRISAWKESLSTAFKLMDRDLLMNYQVDCVASGTTAVALVKQGKDLIVGNVGDSRAILGTKAEDGSMLALQLTVDLKPDIPGEAERIKRYDGRVFALQREPSVYRVWLPDRNAPGLAMSRALGDYCLKNYGVISVPDVTYRQLTEKDKFVVLATDGVWDVLSNDEVVQIVMSVPDKSLAARAIVENAVHMWRSKYTFWKVDDCAVVCLFL